MNSLTNYLITEQIKVHSDRTIYRAVRKSDKILVIIKTLKKDYPKIEETASLLHEYEIVKNISSERIVKVYDIERYKQSFALILEDFGGESLQELLATRKLKLKEFLNVAIQLSLILDEINQQKIIHKDIKPSNIIIHPKTLQVKLTDFGVATRLTKETNTFKKNLWGRHNNSQLLEGTLAYISPEQTGRMNRALDYRSDFYSLGVTFYEMLTGKLPFQAEDSLQLIHYHIATTPIPPYKINPEIPQAVSAIVMKLLAKNAEDRYQSALGLKADLENCLQQLSSNGKVKSFLPGEMDRYGQFLIPQKLYGRSNEVASLLSAFDRVSGGSTEVMLVSGYSGIGKTSVINEIHKPIVKEKGYFISGKFDQFQKNIPYKAIVEAFKILVQQILTEPSEQIALWKEKFKSNLGENSEIIAELIPEIKLISGSQLSIAELGPNEFQNRFNRVFKKFIQIFATKKHPLVLFLDDLQWADLASLKLIELLTTDRDIEYFLIIGAYRDNEVNSLHPAMQTFAKIKTAKTIVNNINLQPLKLDSITELIRDTLKCKVTENPGCDLENLQILSKLLFAKTAGNPFFLNTLLQTLHTEQLLTFNYNSGCWEWDIKKIQAVGITDRNVVELVASNLKKLPSQTQEILKLAACIGHKFDLNSLAIVNERPQTKTALDLWPALQAGVILPLSDTYKIPLLDSELFTAIEDESLKISYKFLHDRVQQAAYSLIPDSEKKQTHLAIGQLLLKNTSAEDREENIFDIVNQLNLSRELITDLEQQYLLAELNLIAGKKAKAASAYQAACEYLNIGLELLQEDSWQQDYQLSLNLHTEALEAEYLNVNFDRAEELSQIVLNRAKNFLEEVKIYEIQIQYYIAQSQMKLAIETALPILRKLGIYISDRPTQFKTILGLLKTKFTQGNRSIEDLAFLPEMKDPYKIAGMRILIAVIPATFVAMPEFFPLTVFQMVNLSIEYGNIPLSICGYSSYGLIHCAVLGDIDAGYRYGKLGLKLLNTLNATDRKAQTHLIFNTFIRHWKEHIKETIEPLAEGIQSGLETGKIEDACYCAAHYCGYLLLSGTPLSSVVKNQTEYIEMLKKNQQQVQMYQAKIWGQVGSNLLAASETPYQLTGNLFNEETMLPLLIESNNKLAVFAMYLNKSLLSYLFRRYSESKKNAFIAEKYADGALSMIYIPLHNFYYSLSLLALYPTASKTERSTYLKKVSSLQKKMKHWAKHAPDNYLHKYQLVEAEKARVLGQNETAIQNYQKAIQSAKSAEYIQEEALANELTAEFYFSSNQESKAREHLMNAYYGYTNWGAVAKVKDIEKRYGQILDRVIVSEKPLINETYGTQSIRGENLKVLDLVTVLKASQVISSEIVLDRLLSRLMHILMENAGGQKGFLFLQQENSLVLASEAKIDSNNKIVVSDNLDFQSGEWPRSLITYVQRTREILILNNSRDRGLFNNDPYIALYQPKSILCFPLISQNQLRGVVYLENRALEGAFTEKRLELLKVLTAQVSISIENARLYKNLEH
ncbi:MAG: AAA family ATPase, partial [Prochloraceae cyanobacterium]|nr:AAA family ATPase [Prochloraceae cyanobacterium]